jgi:para-nitrobenzyl esterase
MSIGTLLGIPAARGLFHRAIAQSGAAHNVSDRETADRVAHGLLKGLDLTPSTARTLVDLDANTLIEAQLRYYDLFRDMTWPGAFVDARRSSAAWTMAYQPVIDGELLPASPLETIAAGYGADVPLIVGSTRDDQRMSELIDPRCPQDADALAKAMALRIPGEEQAARVLTAYPWPNEDRPTAARAFSAMETHRLFRIPALRLAEAHAAQGHRAYVYLFEWTSPIAPLGSSHGLELPFLFDLLDEPGMDLYAGKGPDAETLARTLQQAWIAFAQSGVPRVGDDPWKPYDTEGWPVMRFGAACRAGREPLTGELAAWDGLL